MNHANRRRLGNGTVKEPLRAGHRHEGQHCCATRGFAHKGHVIGVSAESSDVVAYPLESKDLVRHCGISAGLPTQTAHVEVPQRA